MSSRSATVKEPKPLTTTKRKSLATEQLLAALAATDKDAAVTAALEVIEEWLVHDAEINRRLRERYAELMALSAPKKSHAHRPELVPISGPELDHFNPYAKPDAYKLLDWYGHKQFRPLMEEMTPPTLRDLVASVQAREPGTKPASRTRKQDMIDYIVEHVAGSGY